MLDSRPILIATVAATGIAFGSATWLVWNGLDRGPTALETLGGTISGASAREPRPRATPVGIDLLLSRPLFQMPTAPVAEPVLRLEGLSRIGARSAALISLGDHGPRWMQVGETQDGVTLRQIAGSSVSVETVAGTRQLTLGGASMTTPQSSGAASAPTAVRPAPHTS